MYVLLHFQCYVFKIFSIAYGWREAWSLGLNQHTFLSVCRTESCHNLNELPLPQASIVVMWLYSHVLHTNPFIVLCNYCSFFGYDLGYSMLKYDLVLSFMWRPLQLQPNIFTRKSSLVFLIQDQHLPELTHFKQHRN